MMPRTNRRARNVGKAIVGEGKFYLPELDGLRFFAFLLVFVHHAPPLRTLSLLNSHGWIGVDLFFALSAFLIVTLLAKEHRQTGGIRIRDFYIRRGLRIYPLYLVYCLAMMALAGFLGALPFLSWRAIGLLTFTDNLISAFRGYNPIPYAAHLWTISYEEQFYLFIPLLVPFLFKGSRLRAFTAMVAVAAVFTLARSLFIYLQIPHPAIWVLPITHFESIMLGVVVALGGFDRILSRIPSWLVLTAGLLAGWLITRLGNVQEVSWRLMLIYPLIGISTSLLVYFVLRTGKTRWMRWLSSTPLVFLGKVSFGLYVYHLLGLDLGARLVSSIPGLAAVSSRGLLVMLASLLITIAIASASYLLLEKPFLRLKSRFQVIASRPA